MPAVASRESSARAQQVKEAGSHTWSSGRRPAGSPARLSLPHVPPRHCRAARMAFVSFLRDERRRRWWRWRRAGKSDPGRRSGFSHPDFYSFSRLFQICMYNAVMQWPTVLLINRARLTFFAEWPFWAFRRLHWRTFFGGAGEGCCASKSLSEV